MVKLILASAIVVLLVFLGAAFIAWEIHPARWSQDARAAATWVAFFGVLMVVIVVVPPHA